MIPSIYKKVSYLKSNGNQYIDTNIIPNGNQKYEINVQFLNISHNCLYSVPAQVVNSVSRYFSCLLAPSKSINFFIEEQTAQQIGPSSGDQLEKKLIKVDLPGKKIYWGQRNKTLPSTIDYTKLPNTKITLFKNLATNVYSNSILYDFKITENNTITHTLTPVVRKEDEKTGLYDEIEQVFYPNLGSEEFITDYVPDGEESSVNCYLGSTKISKVMLGSTEIQNIL